MTAFPRAFLAALLWLGPSQAGAQEEATRFLFFGDSITIGHGDGSIRCPEPTHVGGYPPRLRDQLEGRGLDVEIANYGACGERTDAGITRIDSVLAAGGDVVVIMEGTNDISEGIALETTLFNLREMARKARNAGLEPLLASVVPRGPDSGRDSNNGKTFQLSLQLAEIAETWDWMYADPFDALFGLSNFFEVFYLDQLHPNPGGYSVISTAFVEPALEAAERKRLCAEIPPGPCVPSDTVLCLAEGRFRVELAEWEGFEGNGGVGQAVPQTDDSGAFYYVDPQNIELVVKVIDGRALNGHFWVFYGALSNLRFSVLVSDTQTRVCREYFNPLGTFASVGDTMAFASP